MQKHQTNQQQETDRNSNGSPNGLGDGNKQIFKKSQINHGKPIVPTSSLRGKPVFNAEGVQLGVLRDLMIETNRGTIAYGILTFEDDKSFALPYSMMQIDPEALTIQTNLQPEVFELGHGMMRLDNGSE